MKQFVYEIHDRRKKYGHNTTTGMRDQEYQLYM
jgi:hypothetical protein